MANVTLPTTTGNLTSKLSEDMLTALPYVGGAYRAYKTFQQFKDIYRGFDKGGLKGGLRSLITTVIPFSGGLFGGGKSKNREEERAINRASSQVISDIKKATKGYQPIETGGLGSRKWQGLSSELSQAYEGLMSARGRLGKHGSRSQAWDFILGASKALKEYGRVGSKVEKAAEGEGKGGTRQPPPQPERGLRLKLPKLPRTTMELPDLPEFSVPRRELGGLTPLPAVGTATGDIVGRVANPYAPVGRTDIPENPLSAKNLKRLRDILS